MSTQPTKPPKIPERAFQIAIGVLLGVATIVAIARISARFYQSRHVAIHDGFFFLAFVTFVAGTILTYFDIPYTYLQENVEAGLQIPPPDFIDQLIYSVRLSWSATTLLGTSIMAVKFSFLFFFRALIRQQKKMLLWWWFILAVLIPTAPTLIFPNMIACPYADRRILVECVTPKALARQNAVLKAVTALDVITDALLISIPILLLWNVQISLRRKFALWAILCLSIFTAITAIITIAGGNISHGQVDSAWVIFWQQAEAAVAVIVVSVSAFRALFVARKASKQKSPGQKEAKYRPTWTWKSKERNLLPTLPSATFTGVRTVIRETPYGARDVDEAVETGSSVTEPQTDVEKHFVTETGYGHESQSRLAEIMV